MRLLGVIDWLKFDYKFVHNFQCREFDIIIAVVINNFCHGDLLLFLTFFEWLFSWRFVVAFVVVFIMIFILSFKGMVRKQWYARGYVAFTCIHGYS